MAHDVFISYAIEDRQFADAMCEALEKSGIVCWYAPRNVPFGVDYEEAIVDAITDSRLVVLILSSHSNNSPHVRREIQIACAEQDAKGIVPVRIEDVLLNKALRYYLTSAQWLDASTSPIEKHLQRLIEQLRARLPQSDLRPGVGAADISEPLASSMLESAGDLTARIARRESGLIKTSQQSSSLFQPKAQPRILRLVVASPGDVTSERDLLPSVVEEVNRGVAADRGLHLVLTRWATDMHPGFHVEGPQGLIDPILNITDCDLVLGIFWKRFGMRTPYGYNDTEHEFGLAHQAWREKGRPQIFVYFNEKAYTPKSIAETEQWGQVLQFRERFPKEGLWWPYKGKIQFEKLVRNHLMNYIRSLPS